MKTYRLAHYPACAGADEAGRGPLAGPVFAAAVQLPAWFDVSGIDDSKKLDARQREALAQRIKDHASFAIAAADVEEVDRLNILHASLAAIARAIKALPGAFHTVYVDGNRLPPGLSCRCEALVKGDSKLACIAAASILAKTARDRWMIEQAETYPGYGFERHFGYPTPEHLEALSRMGPCAIHRVTFAPVRLAFERHSVGHSDGETYAFG